MARTAIPLTDFARNGAELDTAVAGDVTNGHVVPNDGHVGLLVMNASVADAHTLTIELFRTVDGQAVEPRIVAVPANVTLAVGPFPAGDYGASLSVDVDHADLSLVAVRI